MMQKTFLLLFIATLCNVKGQPVNSTEESSLEPTSLEPTTLEPTSERRTTTTVAPCYFPCGRKPDGDYADPFDNCTSHFYVCDNGRCFNFYCPPNLVYDSKNDECVYPSEWVGCGGTTVADYTGSTTSRYTPPACNFNCGNKPDGDYADPTSSCTAHYFVCANGERFNFYCPYPLVYDPDIDECVYPQGWIGCGVSTLSHSPLA